MGCSDPGLHVWIVWPTTAFRWNPGDILVGVLDIASFAVNAVLSIDDKARRAPLFDPFVNTSRAIARGGPAVHVMLRRLLQSRIGHLEMRGLVLLVVGVGEEHRREPIKSELAVGLGISDRRAP